MLATPSRPATLCLTFDNMGQALEIGAGRAGKPDPQERGLAIGYPRMLDLLDELDLKATFFIEGWNGLHHPDRVQQLAERGHDVGLHGWVHEDFGRLDKFAAERVIYDGTAALGRLGLRPTGFRAPGGMRGPHAARILQELNYRYDSSTDTPMADDPEEGDQFVQPGLLATGLAHIPLRHAMVDSVQYLKRRSGPRPPLELQARWLSTIDRLAEARATTTIVIHAYVSGVDDTRFAVVRNVLSHARRRGDIDICTAAALAERVLSHH